MNLDEDQRLDRSDEFQTDDEENLAECGHEDDSDQSDQSPPSRVDSNGCMDIPNPTWPQSYRQSMDILSSFTPTISFLGNNSLEFSNSLSSMHRRHQSSRHSDFDSSITEHLIATNLEEDTDEVDISTLPVQLTDSSYLKPPSIHELQLSENKCSFPQSVLHGINILCGIGMLTVPYAIREGGWLSLLLLLLFAITSCYTGILLKRCLESSPGLRTYPDIGQAAFGVTGRLVISIALYVELYASSVEFVIMMADNLSTLFPNINMNISGIPLNSQQFCAIMATLVVLPTVWLRDLSLLSYLSVGGVLASILMVVCLLWVGVVDNVGFHLGGKALDLSNISVSVGIYAFSFAGHSVFPNIYSSMKEPSQFHLVLILSFLFCGVLYVGVAIIGYSMFGDSIQSQYTLNMPQQFAASKISLWTAVINPLTKYAMTLTPVALSLEELMPSGHENPYFVTIFIRTSLAISTLVVALTVPFFANMMALIGSMLAMLAAIIFPCACYLSICRGRLTRLQTAACIFIIILGFTCGCIGTYSALLRIARAVE
ncbi:hypothetical protein ACFE04_020461 [Oxalis oulophora]